MSSKASIYAMLKGHRPQHNLRYGNDTKFISCCCGNQHQPKHCPAYGQTCTRCTKPNHFAKMCRTKLVQTKTLEKGKHRHSKEVHVVEEQDTQSDLESDSSDDNYTLGMHGPTENRWYREMNAMVIHSQDTKWKNHFQVGHRG